MSQKHLHPTLFIKMASNKCLKCLFSLAHNKLRTLSVPLTYYLNFIQSANCYWCSGYLLVLFTQHLCHFFGNGTLPFLWNMCSEVQVGLINPSHRCEHVMWIVQSECSILLGHSNWLRDEQGHQNPPRAPPPFKKTHTQK